MRTATSNTPHAAIQSLTRQEYLHVAAFLECRAPFLERQGQTKAANVSRGLAYICRSRAARMVELAQAA